MLEVGDRVVCIKGQLSRNLHKGREYVIREVDDISNLQTLIRIEGNNTQFYASRFEKILKSSNLRW